MTVVRGAAESAADGAAATEDTAPERRATSSAVIEHDVDYRRSPDAVARNHMGRENWKLAPHGVGSNSNSDKSRTGAAGGCDRVRDEVIINRVRDEVIINH